MSAGHLPDRGVFAALAPSTAFGGPPPPLRRGGFGADAGRDPDPPPFTGEGDHAQHGGGGAAGHPHILPGEGALLRHGQPPVYTILDEFGVWPLDYVPIAPGAPDDEPELARPGSFWPTIFGVALLALVTGAGLAGAWVLVERVAP